MRESVDWTAEGMGLTPEEAGFAEDERMQASEGDCGGDGAVGGEALAGEDDAGAEAAAERSLSLLLASGLGATSGEDGAGNIGSFALNAVVVSQRTERRFGGARNREPGA